MIKVLHTTPAGETSCSPCIPSDQSEHFMDNETCDIRHKADTDETICFNF